MLVKNNLENLKKTHGMNDSKTQDLMDISSIQDIAWH